MLKIFQGCALYTLSCMTLLCVFASQAFCQNPKKERDVHFDMQIEILKDVDKSTLSEECKLQLQNIIHSSAEYDFARLFDLIVTYNNTKCNLREAKEPLLSLLLSSYMYKPETKEKKNEYVKILKNDARKGDAESIYLLGACYVDPNFPQYNLEKGIKLLTEAANKGNVSAQYHLGVLYSDEGSPLLDFKKSRKFYKMAAKQGDMDANHELGLAYYQGNGVQINDSTALKYFLLAANKGERDAAFYVSAILYHGNEAKNTLEESYFWIKVAEQMKSRVLKENMILMTEIEKSVNEEIKQETVVKVEEFKHKIPAQ